MPQCPSVVVPVLCDLGRAGMEPASGRALIKYRDRGFIKIFAIQARGVNYRMSAARSVRWSEERPGENTNIWRPGGRWMSVWGGGGVPGLATGDQSGNVGQL